MSIKNVPPQRKVRAMIYTPAGWITGQFVLPKLHSLLAFLNGSSGFVKLVDVRFHRSTQEVSFLAIQRDAMTIIIPSEMEDPASSSCAARRRNEQVSCMFARGMVHGVLEVVDNTRVSDFLMQKLNYFSLTDATVALGPPLETPPRAVPLAIINANQLLGITHPAIGMSTRSEAPAAHHTHDEHPVAM